MNDNEFTFKNNSQKTNFIIDNTPSLGNQDLDKIRKNSNEIEEIRKKDRKNYQSFGQTNTSFDFKFVLVGDVNVGKTCIKYQFTEESFDNKYHATIGVEFKLKRIKISNNVVTNIEVWDTCGQERFRSITKQYYRDANGIILVFDITDRRSFDHMEEWLNEIYSNITDRNKISLMLVGNKLDMNEKRIIGEYEAVNLAVKNDMQYLEVSAKENININELFETLSCKIVDRQEQELLIKPRQVINLSMDDNKNSSLKKLLTSSEKKSKSCC